MLAQEKPVATPKKRPAEKPGKSGAPAKQAKGAGGTKVKREQILDSDSDDDFQQAPFLPPAPPASLPIEVNAIRQPGRRSAVPVIVPAGRGAFCMAHATMRFCPIAA